MQANITTQNLSIQRLDEATSVMLDSFLALNPSWKSYGYSFQQLFPYIRTKIQSTISGGLSRLLIRGNKVIGGIVADDILSVSKTLLLPFNLSLFDRSKVTGRYLEKYMPGAGIKKGQALYIVSVFIDPREASKATFLTFFKGFVSDTRNLGWHGFYSLASNLRFAELSVGLGAEVLADIQQGESTRLNFVRLDYSAANIDGRSASSQIRATL